MDVCHKRKNQKWIGWEYRWNNKTIWVCQIEGGRHKRERERESDMIFSPLPVVSVVGKKKECSLARKKIATESATTNKGKKKKSVTYFIYPLQKMKKK